ncbi:MAG: response regulator transcription factor [Spirochaetia bacterium]|nr:response regulator transcription factor [Spirochaetia bacterium]
MPYKIAIIEDTPSIAASLEKIIGTSDDFEHVLTCTSGEIALKKIPVIKPQICLLDLGLPGIGGIEIQPLLKANLPDLKIVVFTVHEEGEKIIQAIQNGADGYLLKDTASELLLAELKVIMLGGATLTPRVAMKVAQLFSQTADLQKNTENQGAVLTDRQAEILNYIVLGFTYSEISLELGISPHTVRRHIENIYQTLQVQTKAEVVKWGLLSGFGKKLKSGSIKRRKPHLK